MKCEIFKSLRQNSIKIMKIIIFEQYISAYLEQLTLNCKAIYQKFVFWEKNSIFEIFCFIFKNNKYINR